MLNKYTFENNTAVIDQPGIINVDKNNVRITTVSGTNSTKIPKDDCITIQVGNIDNIKIGGTKDWGYNNGILQIGYQSGSMTATSILVDNIQVTNNCNWCNYFIADNYLVFQANKNNSTESRCAYFKCTTTDKYITKGDNAGTEVLSEWWITVVQTSNPSPDPQPDPESELLYRVGLISDVHYCITKDNRELISPDWGNNSESESYFADDLKYIINRFNDFYDVDFIASPGDIATNDVNDFIKFTEDYTINKPFYCAMGNHDHQITYDVNDWTSTTQGTDGSRWNSVTGKNTSDEYDSWNCPGSLCGNIPSGQKSNMSYYITKGDKDIYVFLHTNYGSNSDASFHQIHPHNQLSENDPYVQQMIHDCGKNPFEGNESNFNFQYYLPEDLIWLENIIISNPTKRIFVFSHYFLPNKAGGGNKYVPGASTELMGITFHFLNWLNNNNKNVTWFSGHSHISWMDNSSKGLHWTNTNYDYIKPTAEDNATILTDYTNYMYSVTTGNKPYNRDSANLASNEKTGWNIHLPSLSRPKATDKSDQMPACEAAVMYVYTDRVEIKKLGYTRNNSTTYTSYSNSIPDGTLTIYNDGTGVCNDTAPEIDEGGTEPSTLGDNQIKLIIKNDLNQTALFTGYLRFTLQGNADKTDFSFRNTRYYPADGSAGWKLYHDGSVIEGYKHGANTEQLAPGQSLSITYTKRMESHSLTGYTSPAEDISALFGRYFTQTASDNLGGIDVGVAVNRSTDNPNRVDNYPGYYLLRFTDANGNVLNSNPQIKSKGIYHLSIYDILPLSTHEYSKNWSILPYDRENSDILNTAYVTVQ